MPTFGSERRRIGYQVYEGPPGAPPIVLQHGFTASSASFLANVEGLRRCFTVVTVDLLGHGGSDAPEELEPYRPLPAVNRLAALFTSLGFERVLLCGHSLGGALALRFALDPPARLHGLVMINSMSASGTPAWRERVLSTMSGMAARVRALGPGFLKDTNVYPAASRRLPEDARRALAEHFERLSPAGVAGTAEGLVAQVNVFERLGTLRVPMLLVIGDRDEPFVASVPAFLDALPPTVESVTLHGAGHAANLEQPAEFNRAVIAFAEQLGLLAPHKQGLAE